MSWLAAIDPSFVDDRFGAATVDAALARSRIYAELPALDDAGRLTASIVDTESGRLTTPMKVALRVRTEPPHPGASPPPRARPSASPASREGGGRASEPSAAVIDVACACRHPRLCEHAVWLLVDVAFAPALRAALYRTHPPASVPREVDDAAIEARSVLDLVDALPAVRVAALEARTLDDRIAAWLPRGDFDDAELEIAVEITTLADGRSAIMLRHRRRGTTRVIPAKDVLALRLSQRRRALVDLTAPHHADKQALVASRGQASLVVELLKDEIGAFGERFKGHLRFARDRVRPRVEREGERLVVRWRAESGATIAAASDAVLFAGAFPWLWSGPARGFFPVAPDVDLDAALGMQRVPSLPLDEDERVGRAILARGGGLGIDLPSAHALGLPPLERPTFELRLGGTPLDVRGELWAVYRAGRFRIGRQPNDTRDRAAEDEAVARAEAAGLSFEGEGELVAYEESAVRLWQGGMEELRAAGFDVHIAESIAKTRVGPAVEVDVHVGSEVGWLDTELEFRAGALVVEIAELHEAIVRGRRWIALDDGTLARVTEDVAALLGDAVLRDASLRLPSHQLGRLERWRALAGENVRVTIDPRTAARARPALAALPRALSAALRPYQLEGLAWLQHLQRVGAGGLLADDMGLGKTLTTLAFLARWKEDAGGEPSLVVCPTSMLGTWAREAERFTPDLRVARYRRGASFADADVVLVSYGIMRNEAERLVKTRFRAVVLDEAQNVKNPGAETSRAARRLDAEMRIALTGTPVENRLAELWSLLTFANPGMLGALADFTERYEVPMTFRPDGAVAAELRALVRPFVLRRTKVEVLSDLPPKTEIERVCVFGARQKRLYDALAIALRQAVAKKEKKRAGARVELSVLTAILRLRQMACDPRLVDEDASAADSAKRAAFLDLVRELVSEDRRALVFSQFTELLTLWRDDLDRAGVRYEYLDGATRERDAAVLRFQEGDAPLFLISLKAGGAGLNLTAADTVIHLDPWWNEAAEAQATDRAHRPGQTRPVTVVRLVAEGTIEDKLALLKRAKRDLAAAVLRGDLDDDDLTVLLGASSGEADDEPAATS
ncbi:MAG: SNF2 helicase associated domain-containing protein [Labilithrix sp.]|nr:SNF2 helicase associated domain-containing protein [Labilithrix sp.]MCW5816413.1 SNF2 helicase associated domain-containing protein [Labilithrix sp.]